MRIEQWTKGTRIESRHWSPWVHVSPRHTAGFDLGSRLLVSGCAVGSRDSFVWQLATPTEFAMNSITLHQPTPQKAGTLQIDGLRALLDRTDDEARLQALIASIRAHGQLVPVVMSRSTVIDGHMRVAACEKLHRKPFTIQIASLSKNARDAVGIWASLNVVRRHMTQNELALVADGLCTLRPGQKAPSGLTQSTVCKNLGVSADTVLRVRQAKGLAARLGREAEVISRLKKNESPRQVLRDLEGLVIANRNVAISEKNKGAAHDLKAMATRGYKTRFIYADPPWADAVPNAPYPVMPTGQAGDRPNADGTYQTICSMASDVRAVAAPDAVLWLWTTSSLLLHGVQVMEAWGFHYVTMIVWAKHRAVASKGAVKPKHELLLIGSMRDRNANQVGEEQNVVLVGKRGAGLGSGKERIESVVELPAPPQVIHSRKPEQVAMLAERLYPNEEKLELFARQPRKGWTVWGNQADGGDLKRIADERSHQTRGHAKRSAATGMAAHASRAQHPTVRARTARVP